MKIGRNDPCICGSGKKYKRCCIDKKEEKTENNQCENSCPCCGCSLEVYIDLEDHILFL